MLSCYNETNRAAYSLLILPCDFKISIKIGSLGNKEKKFIQNNAVLRGSDSASNPDAFHFYDNLI